MKKKSINMDTTGPHTKMQRVINAILNAINYGAYEIGDELPSINKLSTQFELSRDTVFKAYCELKKRGLVESTPAKGYRVARITSKVLLFLDSYSPFKDELYNSFASNLPPDYKVDLAFHHYNYAVFESVLLDSIGKYNMYVVMNFNNEKISDILYRIDANKLLILDWGKYKDEKYAYVCQDFGEQPYNCLVQARDMLKKYRKICCVYPEGSYHPAVTLDYFKRFCSESCLPWEITEVLDDASVLAGQAYFFFRQKDLVDLLKIARAKGLRTGIEIGLLAYNDSPLFEVIEKGITTISTDFRMMGVRAAEYVKTKERIQEIIPTRLIIRNSL
jgi:DNA-binding transcriptional regulator YhcF (GntR family)